MTITASMILEMVGVYLWPFMRIGALLLVMPAIGGSFVPARVRILLAMALTMVIAPTLPPPPAVDVLSLAGVMTIGREVLIGMVMGFVVQVVFDAIALGGQIISMSMGLGFAVFVDQQRGINIPVLGQLFMMLSLLLFFVVDGHLAMIRLLADSFRILPIGGSGISQGLLGGTLQWVGQLFVVAVKIALPAITALIIVNLSFGVMSRAAPTLNLFAVGFPAAMLLGFVAIFLSMGNLQENVSQLLDAALALLPELLES